MRDPERIKRITEKLAEIWARYPDLRFGQLLAYVTGRDVDNTLWHKEDDEWERIMSSR